MSFISAIFRCNYDNQKDYQTNNCSNSGITEKIKTIWERANYYLSHTEYATKTIALKDLSKIRNNETIEHITHTPQSFPTLEIVAMKPWEKNPQENAEFEYLKEPINNFLDSNKKYCTFNLSTTHKTFGIFPQSHNVTLLYCKEKKQLFCLDGKANNPDSLYMQDLMGKSTKKSVSNIIDFIKNHIEKTDSSEEKIEVAYCKVALQRTNDCAILPEYLTEKIIKEMENSNNKNAQDLLDNVTGSVTSNFRTIYRKINEYRDSIYQNKTQKNKEETNNSENDDWDIISTQEINTNKPKSSNENDENDWDIVK